MTDDTKHFPRIVPSPTRTGMTQLPKLLLETTGLPLFFEPFARTDRPAHQFVLAPTGKGKSACQIETGHTLVIGKSRVGKTRLNMMTTLNFSSDE